MQNDQIYSDIISSITEKDDITILNTELDLLEKSIYELNDTSNLLKNSLRAHIYSSISELLKTETKQAIIKKLRSKLAEIAILELTLSTDPKEKTIETLAQWLAKHLPLKVALDIKIDHKIIGGAIIVFNGKYFDGSLRNSLDSVLKNYV